MLAADPGDLHRPAPTAVSLYIHVPFCVSKCAYCDFYSMRPEDADLSFTRIDGLRVSRVAPDPRDAFVDAVLSTLEWAASPVLGDVATVYIGGGTPTVLGGRLVDLVDGVLARAGVRPGAEVTVETNPETTTPELTQALVESGVNRFSLGVQSLDDDVLRTLGRCHDAARALEACATLARSDAPFSIDLMCGVPGQSLSSFSETLERASQTGALHASIYALSVEPGTPMAARIEAGELCSPDPDEAAAMMELANRSMAYHAMDRYEVANWAYPGCESRHNLGYWTGRPYVGVGPGAHSMLPAAMARTLQPSSVWTGLLGPEVPDEARVRFCVNDTLEDFALGGWDRMPSEMEVLTSDEAAREDVMLGMRLTLGVPVAQAGAAGVEAALERLEAAGLVERHAGSDGVERWRTTERGWLLGNEVFAEVWTQE